MNFITTVSSVALLLASSLSALIIRQPLNHFTTNAGQPLTIEVINDLNENYTSAEVSIASPTGNLVINVPVGTAQSVYLPCNVLGQTDIVARVGEVVSNRVLIMINPALPGYYYGNSCILPCQDACGPLACPPRASRRSRRGCGYYAEKAQEISEFKAEDFEQQQ